MVRYFESKKCQMDRAKQNLMVIHPSNVYNDMKPTNSPSTQHIL